MDLLTALTNYTNVRSLSLAPRTIEAEKRFLSLYLSPLSRCDTETITASDIIQPLAALRTQGHTRTALAVWMYLRSASRHIGGHFAQLMQTIERPKHVPKQISILTSDDLSILISAAPSDLWRLCWYLAGVYCLRRGEICGLMWSDINKDANILTIQRQRVSLQSGTIISPPKTRAGLRDLPITDYLSNLLLSVSAHSSSSYIIPYAPHSLDNALRAQLAALGLPRVTVHGLRHTGASMAVNDGCNLRVLQSVLGHASVQTTASVYSHVSRSSLFNLLSHSDQMIHQIV